MVGAVHSGVSAVAFALILLRWCYGWQDYIRHEHIDALGRLLIVVATGWFYFLVMEILFGMYGREADELMVRQTQFTYWPYNFWFILFVITTYFIPGGPVVEPGVAAQPVDHVHRLHIGERRNVAGAFPDHRAGPDQQAVVHLRVGGLPAQHLRVHHHRFHLRAGNHADAAVQPGVPAGSPV